MEGFFFRHYWTTLPICFWLGTGKEIYQLCMITGHRDGRVFLSPLLDDLSQSVVGSAQGRKCLPLLGRLSIIWLGTGMELG